MNESRTSGHYGPGVPTPFALGKLTPRDDLVRRLMLEHREHQTVYGDDRRRKALFSEAADEVTRLRLALIQIRDHYDDTELASKHMAAIARAALPICEAPDG